MPLAPITSHWLTVWVSGAAPPAGPMTASTARGALAAQVLGSTSQITSDGAEVLEQSGTRVLAGVGNDVETY